MSATENQQKLQQNTEFLMCFFSSYNFMRPVSFKTIPSLDEKVKRRAQRKQRGDDNRTYTD